MAPRAKIYIAATARRSKKYKPLSAKEALAQNLGRSAKEASSLAKAEREAEKQEKASRKAEASAEKARTKAEREQSKALKKEEKALKKAGAGTKVELKLQFLRDIDERLEAILAAQRSIKALRAGRAQSLADMRKHRDRITELRGEIKDIRAKARKEGVRLGGGKK